jgi:hypothetical protein
MDRFIVPGPGGGTTLLGPSDLSSSSSSTNASWPAAVISAATSPPSPGCCPSPPPRPVAAGQSLFFVAVAGRDGLGVANGFLATMLSSPSDALDDESLSAMDGEEDRWRRVMRTGEKS